MATRRKKDAKAEYIKERKKTAASKIAYSNPKMIKISMYEIESIMSADSVAKYILIIGSALVGAVLSAFYSNITVSPLLSSISFATFIFGILFDQFVVNTKRKELLKKGADIWK